MKIIKNFLIIFTFLFFGCTTSKNMSKSVSQDSTYQYKGPSLEKQVEVINMLENCDLASGYSHLKGKIENKRYVGIYGTYSTSIPEFSDEKILIRDSVFRSNITSDVKFFTMSGEAIAIVATKIGANMQKSGEAPLKKFQLHELKMEKIIGKNLYHCELRKYKDKTVLQSCFYNQAFSINSFPYAFNLNPPKDPIRNVGMSWVFVENGYLFEVAVLSNVANGEEIKDSESRINMRLAEIRDSITVLKKNIN